MDPLVHLGMENLLEPCETPLTSFLDFDESWLEKPSYLNDQDLIFDADQFLTNFTLNSSSSNVSGESSPLHSPLSTQSSEDNSSTFSDFSGTKSNSCMGIGNITENVAVHSIGNFGATAQVYDPGNIAVNPINKVSVGLKRIAPTPTNDFVMKSECVPYVILVDSQSNSPVSLRFNKNQPPPEKKIKTLNNYPQIQPKSGNTQCERVLSREEERKIRNRQFAQISRDKRKMGMQKLETQLKEAKDEVLCLKHENEQLRNMVIQLTVNKSICSCGSAVSPPLTPVTPANPMPSPTRVSLMSSPSLNTAFKSSVVSLAVVMIMFTFNFTGQTKLPMRKVDIGIEPRFHSRQLLTVDYESEDTVNYTQDINSTLITDKINCSQLNYHNQTENLRLNDELESWMSKHKKVAKGAYEPFHNSLNKLLNWSSQRKGLQPLKYSNLAVNEKKNLNLLANLYAPKTKEKQQNDDGGLLEQYKRLIDALGRREDTFYLVALQQEYLLLPATSHNSTHRPRMSLIVPTRPFNSSESGAIESLSMIKIDCEVTNTANMHLPHKLNNTPLPTNNTLNNTQVPPST